MSHMENDPIEKKIKIIQRHKSLNINIIMY